MFIRGFNLSSVKRLRSEMVVMFNKFQHLKLHKISFVTLAAVAEEPIMTIACTYIQFISMVQLLVPKERGLKKCSKHCELFLTMHTQSLYDVGWMLFIGSVRISSNEIEMIVQFAESISVCVFRQLSGVYLIGKLIQFARIESIHVRGIESLDEFKDNSLVQCFDTK